MSVPLTRREAIRLVSASGGFTVLGYSVARASVTTRQSDGGSTIVGSIASVDSDTSMSVKVGEKEVTVARQDEARIYAGPNGLVTGFGEFVVGDSIVADGLRQSDTVLLASDVGSVFFPAEIEIASFATSGSLIDADGRKLLQGSAPDHEPSDLANLQPGDVISIIGWTHPVSGDLFIVRA